MQFLAIDDTPLPRPTVVAIIPLYNGARFIEQAVCSVLAQTVKPDEFIVVDDGSTDEGPSLVERLAREHPIRLIRKRNGGQSSARNLGVAESRSDLIALLDQDDVWYPHHIETLIEPFEKRRDLPLGWSYSNLDEVDEAGFLVSRNFLRRLPAEHPKVSLASCLGHDMFVLPSASLISRAAFEAVGGFDERLSGYEDDDLFLRLFRHGYDNVFLDQPLSQWRIYSGSTSYSPRMARSRMIYARKLMDAYPNDGFANRYYARDLIAPRFVVPIVGQFLRAVGRADRAAMAQSLEDLAVLIPSLRLRYRLVFGLARPFMRSYALSRLALSLRLTGLPRALLR